MYFFSYFLCKKFKWKEMFANDSGSSSSVSQAHCVNVPLRKTKQGGCYSKPALPEARGGGCTGEQKQVWDQEALDPNPNLHLLTGGRGPRAWTCIGSQCKPASLTTVLWLQISNFILQTRIHSIRDLKTLPRLHRTVWPRYQTPSTNHS